MHWLLFLWRWNAFPLQTLWRATLLLAILNLSQDVFFVVHYQMLISLSDIRTTLCLALDFLSVSSIILSTLITLFFSVFLKLLLVKCWLIPYIFFTIFFPYFLILQNALPEPSSWWSKLAIPVIFPTLSIFKRFKSNSFPKFWSPKKRAFLAYLFSLLFFELLGIQLRVLYMEGKHSSTELHVKT